MRVALLLFLITALAACGVKGPLYRPSEPKPDPKTKNEHNIMHPFPGQQPMEQDIMPDLI